MSKKGQGRQYDGVASFDGMHEAGFDQREVASECLAGIGESQGSGISCDGQPGSSMMRVAACSAALMLVFSEYWLLNYCAFPLFDSVFIWTREVSACVGGAVLAGVALLAFWRPRAFSVRLFTEGPAVAMLVGAALAAASVALSSPLLVVVGASLLTIGGGLANVFVGMGCVGLRLRDVGVAIVWAYVASFAARWAFALIPLEANLALFVALPLASIALVAKPAAEVFAHAVETESPAQLSVTSPLSFVPFGHQVFISLVVFRFVYGYTLTFGEVDRVPVVAFWALVPLCVLLVYVLAARRVPSPDALFRASILFSVAGFLVVSITGESRDVIASSLLSAGTGFFEVMMYCVLISLGSRNHAGALSALAWGNAMASWGTILGAAFGRLTNQVYHVDATALTAVSAVIVFAFVVYILFVLQRFSFERTINEVAPAQNVVVDGGVGVATSVDAADVFDAACVRLADRKGLTEREREVFDLLAHGRNARFIQESLTVSYNTVKTHVSHIYAKLGVHTHQELIDAVEREREEGGKG